MALEINKNYTYYNTSDIIRLLEGAANQVGIQVNVSVRVVYQNSDDFNGEVIFKVRNRRVRYSWSRQNNSLPSRVTLCMPRKSNFAQTSAMNYMAETLVRPSKNVAPASLTESLVSSWILLFSNASNKAEDLAKWAKLQDPIGWDTKQSRNRLSVEESLAHMKELYGPGRVMRGSSRTWTGRWRVSTIGYYYEREFDRREKWRTRFEAKGGVLQPDEIHETFPEYLRRMADEIEANPKC